MHHGRLDPESVPATDARLTELLRFAATFEGYAAPALERARSRAALERARGRAAFEADGTLPDDVDELRAALFHAQRVHYWAHTGGFLGVAPGGAGADWEVTSPPASFTEPLEEYMRALAAAIREAVA